MIIARGIDIDEFFDGDFPPGAELLDGDVIVNDPTHLHQEFVKRFLVALELWIRAGDGRGRTGTGGNWVARSRQTLKPDVWWVSHERAPGLDTIRTSIAPNICIEVRSPGTWKYDIGRKRRRYEDAGAQELWLVDTIAKVVIVLRRSSEQAPEFDEDAELGAGEQLTSPLLDGFSLSIDELFDR